MLSFHVPPQVALQNINFTNTIKNGEILQYGLFLPKVLDISIFFLIAMLSFHVPPQVALQNINFTNLTFNSLILVFAATQTFRRIFQAKFFLLYLLFILLLLPLFLLILILAILNN